MKDRILPLISLIVLFIGIFLSNYVNASVVLNASDVIGFNVSGKEIAKVTSSGVFPSSTNSYDLGSSSLKWANIYAVNVHADNINGGSAVTGSGSSGQVAFWTGSSSISGDNNLYWDNSNKRLGIGTTSPAYPLDVNGRIKANNVIIGGAESGVGSNGANMIDLGVSATRQADEGKIWYRASWDSDTLAIVGATASGSGTRHVRIWDCLGIGKTCTEQIDITGNVRASKFIDNQNTGGYIDLWAGVTSGGWINFPNNAWGGGGDDAYIRYYNDSSGENTRLLFYIGNDAADDMYFKASGPITFESTVSNYIQSLDELRAPRFVDKDNTAYYLDPSSNTNSLKVAGGIELSGPTNTGVNLNGVKILVTNYDNDDSNPTSIIFAKDENGYVDFFVNSSTTQGGLPLMYFRGKVGIGTTDPGEKLEVNGNVKLSSSNPVINLNGVAVKKIGSTIVISDVV